MAAKFISRRARARLEEFSRGDWLGIY